MPTSIAAVIAASAILLWMLSAPAQALNVRGLAKGFPQRKTSTTPTLTPAAQQHLAKQAEVRAQLQEWPVPPTRPCDNWTNAHHPFCFEWLTIDERIADLVPRIELNNTGTLFSSWVGNITQQELWLPPYIWWSEGLHGVASSPGVNYNGEANATTSFPQVCLTAASFNKTLYAAIGNVVGTEGRAMHNLRQAGLTFWAPNINIYRDPRWGRGQETPGEDPFLTATYAKNFVYNMQFNDLDPTRLRVSSCCKHYDCYDLDNWGDEQRNWFNALVSQYDLDHTFNVPFEACYHQDGGAASGMMCSYNAVNGIPSCANKAFITDTARNTWGFNGYVTSDCGATGNVEFQHMYTNNNTETVKVTLEAGMDTDCGYLIANHVAEAVLDNVTTRGVVNTALSHLFKVQMRLGMFDSLDVQPYSQLGISDICTPAHLDLTLDAAREGVTLLYNKNGALPLDASDFPNGEGLLVMGPLANNSQMMLGNYYGVPPYIINPVDWLTQRVGTGFTYLDGLNHVQSQNITQFDQACELAARATAILLFMGNDQTVEREGNDRYEISFPDFQDLFIRRVSHCAGSRGVKVFVVVFSGGSMDYRPTMAQSAVHGILWAGYPGMNGGRAIVEILFGDVSPSGRLVQTAYPAEYVNEVAMTEMTMEANETTGNPGRTYRYYTGTPVFRFGYGLSYSNFTLQWNASGSESGVGDGDALPTLHLRAADIAVAVNSHKPLFTISLGVVSWQLTNNGPMAAAASLLLFVKKSPPAKEIGGELTDFDKVFLDVGQSAYGNLQLNSHVFVRVEGGKRVVQKGTYTYEVDVMSQAKRQGLILVE